MTTEAIDTTDTTLLPVDTTSELPLEHRFAIDCPLGIEVGGQPVVRIGQEVSVAVRARITGLSEREGYKARVRTLRADITSIDAIDDEPVPVPPVSPIPAEVKTVTVPDPASKWWKFGTFAFGFAWGIGLVAQYVS